MPELSTAPEGWEHATRDLKDGTTINHGDTVLVEAEYTQSDRPESGKLSDPPGPDDKLWLNVQGHAPVMAPLAAVRVLGPTLNPDMRIQICDLLRNFANWLEEHGQYEDEEGEQRCKDERDQIDAALAVLEGD